MAEFRFSVPTLDADGRLGTLSGSVSAPDDSLSNWVGVRDAVADYTRKQGYEPVDIGIYRDNH